MIKESIAIFVFLFGAQSFAKPQSVSLIFDDSAQLIVCSSVQQEGDCLDTIQLGTDTFFVEALGGAKQDLSRLSESLRDNGGSVPVVITGFLATVRIPGPGGGIARDGLKVISIEKK